MKLFEPFIMLALLIGLGMLLYYRKIVDLEFSQKWSRLVVRVTFPAMLFISMYNNIEFKVLEQGWVFIILGLVTSLFLAFTAHFFGRLFKLKGMSFGTFKILCTNGNNIFLPLPIISAIFGAEYIIYAVLFELGAGLFYWSYGISHFQKGPKLSLKRLFNQNILALIAGFIFGLHEIGLPQSLINGLEIVGNITIGSAMLIIGSLVAHFFSTKLSWRREVWGVLLHRLLLSPLVGVVFLPFLRLNPEIRTILFLMLAMPPLTTTALVAASYNADEELATLGVIIPTLASIIIIPLLLLWIMR